MAFESNGHEYVIVQYRDETGSWRDLYSGVLNDGGRVLDAMQQAKRFVGEEKNVRAVTREGRMVDYLA